MPRRSELVPENYAAWKITTESRPVRSVQELMKVALQYAVLAASTHNSQPWLYQIDGNVLVLKPDLKRILPYSDPSSRGLLISQGTFIANYMVAVHSLGWSAKLDVQANNVETFEVRVSHSKTAGSVPDGMLEKYVSQRRSDKSTYDGSKISAELIRQLKQDSWQDVGVFLSQDSSVVQAMAEQYLSAGGFFAMQMEFRREIAAWLRANNSKKPDGMPGSVSEIPFILSLIAPVILPLLAPVGKMQVKKDATRIQSSSGVGFIVTAGDKPHDWFDAGVMLGIVHLRATQLGVAMTPMAALIENDDSREKIKVDLSDDLRDGYPQMFFRFGRPLRPVDRKANNLHTPRKSVMQV